MKVPSLSSLRQVRRGPSLVAGMALAAAGFVNAAPVVSVHAFACPLGANLVVRPGPPRSTPTPIDPQATLSSLIVPASLSPRSYATIVDGNFYRNQTVLGFGGTYTKVCIDTVGPQPSTWPVAPSGDTGVQFAGCAQSSQDSGYIGKDIVVVAHNADGTPILDGPYNPEEGWAFCGSATFGAGQAGQGPIDSFVFWQDPNGNSTFIDHNNGLVLPPAAWVGNQVTFYIPDTLQYTLPANPSSPAITVNEKLFNPADATEATNATVVSLATTAVNLPVPVCPSTIVPGTGDCMQTEGTISAPTHWAPGQELGIPANHIAGLDLGLQYGLLPVSAPPSCADIDGVPLSDDPGNPPHETTIGYPTLADFPAGTANYTTPLVGTPLGANCAVIIATLPGGQLPCSVGGNPLPPPFCTTAPDPLNVFEYDNRQGLNGGLAGGRITGHDIPAIPAGTLPNQFAPDHLTGVYDFTGNGF